MTHLLFETNRQRDGCEGPGEAEDRGGGTNWWKMGCLPLAFLRYRVLSLFSRPVDFARRTSRAVSHILSAWRSACQPACLPNCVRAWSRLANTPGSTTSYVHLLVGGADHALCENQKFPDAHRHCTNVRLGAYVPPHPPPARLISPARPPPPPDLLLTCHVMSCDVISVAG